LNIMIEDSALTLKKAYEKVYTIEEAQEMLEKSDLIAKLIEP